MTLSLAILLRARHAYLHIVGAAKQAVLNRACGPGEIAQLPIRALLRSEAPALEIYYANGN